MELPDREVLAKFHLASVGFHDYDKYGKVLNSVNVMCEEKLTKCKWYDFGLRTLLLLIRIAGTLLLKPKCTEHDALSGAFMLGCSGRLLDEDIEGFEAILTENGLDTKQKGGSGWGLDTKATIPTGYTAE